MDAWFIERVRLGMDFAPRETMQGMRHTQTKLIDQCAIIGKCAVLALPLALLAAACDDTVAAVDEEAREESHEIKQDMEAAEREAEEAAAEAKQDVKVVGREIKEGAKAAAEGVVRAVDAADKAVADEIRDDEPAKDAEPVQEKD